MIGLDLQESPPLSSCFVLRVKSGESDGGSIRGRGEEAEGESRAALKGENEQRASSHPCSDHVNRKDVCVCMGERHRG